jgi:uncharacterized protein (DUF427 family)
MGVRLQNVLGQQIGDLRYEPTQKRVRASVGDEVIVDSDRAVLVWEPRRVTPTYAVPAEHVFADLVAATSPPAENGAPDGFAIPDLTRLPVLDPRIPFAVHTTDGDAVEVRSSLSDRTVAGFRPSDPDLAGYVILDFDGFDTWREEEDEIVGHPRDPFHRIDVLNSSRHIQLALGGRILADTTRARLLFETMLPVRYYLPREDVLVDLEPSAKTTYCAYKGRARYWSIGAIDGAGTDLIWCYEEPLTDASAVAGYLAFFDERSDLVVDGTPRERPVTPWS